MALCFRAACLLNDVFLGNFPDFGSGFLSWAFFFAGFIVFFLGLGGLILSTVKGKKQRKN